MPEGVPEPEVTVAVNETDWPGLDGFGPAERTTAVAVGAEGHRRPAEDLDGGVVPLVGGGCGVVDGDGRRGWRRLR